MKATQDSGSAAEQLALGFAQQVQAWSRRQGAGEAVAQLAADAAAALIHATSSGHVCLALSELLPATGVEPSALREALLASGVVGTPQAPGARPLLLDSGDRLYLHRHFDDERRLARRLLRAAAAPPDEVDEDMAALLRSLFAANRAALAGAVDHQQLAAALALRRRLLVVSGGPGTGKTTTVVRLLALLLARDPACRIALTAPTGKAAARLADAVRLQAPSLPAALRERLPQAASTVHRLLGVTRAGGGFVHHAGHRLPIDVLVVDEASMLDLALAARLFDAVPESARIVLLGDKDQLAAVESGAVFAELAAAPWLDADCRADLASICGLAPDSLPAPQQPDPGALPNSVVWFDHNHRFAADSGIGRLAADIQAGRSGQALAGLRDGRDPAVQWLADEGGSPGAACLERLREGFAPYLDAVRGHPADAAAVAAAFDRFRVLCALREGPRGVLAINAWMTRQAATGAAPWFAGRPVMVLRNDLTLRLFNGDIGFTLPADDVEGTLRVHFPDPAGGWRALSPQQLPAHETAFAMTVHKAQGSEFDGLLLMLPAQPGRVLTRELLYTAVTRARRGLTLVGSAEVVAAAIGAPTRRHSGLLARLHEATLATATPDEDARA